MPPILGHAFDAIGARIIAIAFAKEPECYGDKVKFVMVVGCLPYGTKPEVSWESEFVG